MNTQHAYTAGIIDGEGSIGIARQDNVYRLSVQVSMKVPSPVPRWLRTHYGGGYGEYKQSRNAFGSGMIAKWSIHGTEAQDFLADIRPYLIEKADQADVALVFPVSRTRSKPEKEIQEECRQMIKELR